MADALEAAGIAYAFTGALAAGHWSVARATQDIDVVIYGGRVPFARALNALAAIPGFSVDPAKALAEATSDGHTVFAAPISLFGPTLTIAVDAILPRLGALADREAQRAVRIPWNGRKSGVPIVSAEDLVLFKLIYFRDTPFKSDLHDIEAILATQKRKLDAAYVLTALSSIYPAADKRVVWFKDAVARILPRRKPPRKKSPPKRRRP